MQPVTRCPLDGAGGRRTLTCKDVGSWVPAAWDEREQSDALREHERRVDDQAYLSSLAARESARCRASTGYVAAAVVARDGGKVLSGELENQVWAWSSFSGHPSSFAPSTAVCRVSRCFGSAGS